MSVNRDFDRMYLRSIEGLSKITCLVSKKKEYKKREKHSLSAVLKLCGFIGFLCIACSSVRLSNFRGCFYMIVVVIGFVAMLTMFVSRYLRLGQGWQLNVMRCSLGVHAALALSHFVASGLVLSLDIGAYTAAAFFGLTIFSINALETYGSYRRSRQRDVATQTV
ncbi:hypothetical protein KR093_006057 [Drosophila rubida]|uniref:MARVEL domain-containing protein n=1 Tax=Drosophila rubida TaxID=30044 RepID=A0AAD4KC72_9MUSC|nr:hypothetical protein KR093_006057 [Drosophila rubida]